MAQAARCYNRCVYACVHVYMCLCVRVFARVGLLLCIEVLD